MIRPGNDIQVYLYAEPVDMRKSIDGLSILVEQEMELQPNMDALFVFCNRGRDKIKMLCWERNGFIVRYKHLEKQALWAQGVGNNESEPGSNGVVRAANNLASILTLLPGINTAVSKALCTTGHSFAQITQLSRDELMAIKGIGGKTADHIHMLFNSMR